MQAIFVKDGDGKVIHFVRIAVGDPDRIPEAPQPECPTGGCARDRAKAEAAKEEL